MTDVEKDQTDPKKMSHDGGLDLEHKDPMVRFLNQIIRYSVRVLAVLMTLVIIWGVLDVVWVIYNKLSTPPIMLLKIEDILVTFAAFLAVLIAIEIFINITMYLQDDVIHVNLVIATALMAIARKVIVLDYANLQPEYLWGTAALVIALGVTYWLLSRRKDEKLLK